MWTKFIFSLFYKENIFSKIGSYSSKVSADYIMDIIFSLLFKNNNNINLIEKLERAKNIQNIEFLGKKSNPYPYLKKSDCLIMSSDFEGYPVVFIESMILGKPIITTNVSDSQKDIKDKFGIVVERSTKGVYEGMKKYLDCGFNMEKFNPEEFNKNIIEKLKQIIS